MIVPPVLPDDLKTVHGLKAANTASQRLVTELGTFDDIPSLISDTEPRRARPRSSVSAPPIPPPIPSSAFTAASEIKVAAGAPPLSVGGTVASRLRRPSNDAVLLITRQAVYAQAGLMAALVILAFVAGLIVGRSHPSPPAPAAKKTADEPVPLEGRVLYAFSPGESLPDAGAIVIALPADRPFEIKITASSLADGDDLATDSLLEFGGAIATADDEGQFQLVAPRAGEYSILIISRHAIRPEDSTMASADRDELSRYFDAPNALIGQKRYALTKRRLSGAPSPLTQEFGPTDKR